MMFVRAFVAASAGVACLLPLHLCFAMRLDEAERLKDGFPNSFLLQTGQSGHMEMRELPGCIGGSLELDGFYHVPTPIQFDENCSAVRAGAAVIHLDQPISFKAESVHVYGTMEFRAGKAFNDACVSMKSAAIDRLANVTFSHCRNDMDSSGGLEVSRDLRLEGILGFFDCESSGWGGGLWVGHVLLQTGGLLWAENVSADIGGAIFVDEKAIFSNGSVFLRAYGCAVLLYFFCCVG